MIHHETDAESSESHKEPGAVPESESRYCETAHLWPFMVAAPASIKLMVSELLPSLLICDWPKSGTTIEAMKWTMVSDSVLRDQCPARDWSRQLPTTRDASGAHRRVRLS